jgi:predicted phosphodiesterase
VIAALYDIHGNLPALEAVLDDIRNMPVERIVIGGDVLPGPLARECLELLLRLDRPVDFIQGNGDRETIALRRGQPSTFPDTYRDAMRWGADQLSPEHEQWVASWPATLRVPRSQRPSLLFCHATPRNDIDIFTRVTPEERLRPLFEDVGADLVVCGHTHMQFDRVIAGIRVVNAGSVGMPFGPTGAYWLLVDSGVELRRTTYDLEGAAARIRASGYPMAEQFAATNVLNPPTEEQMIAIFEQNKAR